MADVAKHHHVQQEVALNRPSYRESRWNRAVKVFTVNQESKYLLVMNVPSIGVVEELLALFRVYGEIEEYRILEDYPHEKFTDVFFFKYKQIDSARTAKRKLDNWYFFSRQLHVCYAPEFEMQEETREKIYQRKTVVGQKTSIAGIPHRVLPSGAGLVQQPLAAIGSLQDQLQRFRHPLPPGIPPPHLPSSPPTIPLTNPFLLAQPPMVPFLSPGHGSPVIPRPSMFIPTPSVPTHPPPFIPPELHNRIHHHHQLTQQAMIPPPSMLVHPRSRVPPPHSCVPRSPNPHKTTNQKNEVEKVLPVQKPPPLISDHCPPPLISLSLTKTPPPLVSTVTSSNVTRQSVLSVSSSELRSVQSAKPATRTGLSINDRIKMHLEQGGDSCTTDNCHRGDNPHKAMKADMRTPVICQKQPNCHRNSPVTVVHTVESSLDTPHIIPGKGNNKSTSITTSNVFSAEDPKCQHVPVVSVQDQPQIAASEAADNQIITISRDYRSSTSDIQTGSTSVDTTVSNIRNKMTEIFKPCSPELQEPCAKKRRRI